ncbi:unnamed protein product [Malus baccata var. baccata]
MVNYATGLMKLVDVELALELSIHRVVNQGVKDLEGLAYLIGCEVNWFTKKDFCLITELRCDEPYDLEVDPSNIRLLIKYFPQKFVKVKTAPKKATNKVSIPIRVFKECKDKDDALKMGLVYFADGVLIGAKSNMGVNLEYLDLVEDMDRLNTYSWCAISFEQLQDNLFLLLLGK